MKQNLKLNTHHKKKKKNKQQNIMGKMRKKKDFFCKLFSHISADCMLSQEKQCATMC